MTSKRPAFDLGQAIETGRIRHSRAARATTCPRCRYPVMTGWDAPLMAFLATCNPQPLTAFGEFTALINGQATYDLRWTANRYQIDRRYAPRIRTNPAGKPNADYDVVSAHQCGILPMHITRINVTPPIDLNTGEIQCPF